MAKVNLPELIARLPADEQERIHELSARITAGRERTRAAEVTTGVMHEPARRRLPIISENVRTSLTVMGRNLRVVVAFEDGAHVARCLDVEVVSDGDTEENARANLKEALDLYFEAPSSNLT